MLPVVLRPAAVAELRAARDWYEDQRPGLGGEFASAVSDTLDFVSGMPEACQVVDKERGIRRALARRFPYAAYYVLELDRVVVLAVLHVARDPAAWQRRG